MTVKAHEVLEAGVKHMQDRAATYDKPDGERSMEATVNAFNVITGDGLMNTEERGWLFMNILKMVRSQQGEFKLDNYEDGAAYWGLAAEAAHKERVIVDWPTDDRIEAIGQNGNDGAVYKKYRDLEKPWEWQIGDYAEVDRCGVRCGEILSGAISDISEGDDGALIFQLVGVDGLFLSGAFNSVIEKSAPVCRDHAVTDWHESVDSGSIVVSKTKHPWIELY